MPRTAAKTTQADVARILRAAKQAGAPGVEVRTGDTVVWVPFSEQARSQSAELPIEPIGEVVL